MPQVPGLPVNSEELFNFRALSKQVAYDLVNVSSNLLIFGIDFLKKMMYLQFVSWWSNLNG